jgi:alkylation response protein AidB-like acyl-CoA dehydrogenase
MRFAFTDDQLLLRDAVRDLLTKECMPARVREAWENDTGLLPDVWSGLADMGVLGLLVPEAEGGLGLSELELVLVLEETGRVALPGPIVETAAVAAPVLGRASAASGGSGTWSVELAGIADGSLLVTTRLGADRLLGWADSAAFALAATADGGLELATVDRATLTAQPSVDASRRRFAGVLAPGGRAVAGAAADASDRGALGAAAQLLGLADRMLELTTDHVKQREQFGVPIGSFQAVKHHLADAELALSFARPVVHNAAYSVAHDLDTAPRDVSMAKAFASDAAHVVGRQALQCHGAIGYTVEYDLHLYLKRAWALAASWGDADWHRDRVGTLIGI